MDKNTKSTEKRGLKAFLKSRKARYGADFPCLIRADYRTKHKDVSRVMNICAACGVWKLSFVAVQEAKGSMSRHAGKK